MFFLASILSPILGVMIQGQHVSCASRHDAIPYSSGLKFDEIASCAAVRFATFVKKHLALKPALEHARKVRGDLRTWKSEQVDRMF
jgi:hypothetical protein